MSLSLCFGSTPGSQSCHRPGQETLRALAKTLHDTAESSLCRSKIPNAQWETAADRENTRGPCLGEWARNYSSAAGYSGTLEGVRGVGVGSRLAAADAQRSSFISYKHWVGRKEASAPRQVPWGARAGWGLNPRPELHHPSPPLLLPPSPPPSSNLFLSPPPRNEPCEPTRVHLGRPDLTTSFFFWGGGYLHLLHSCKSWGCCNLANPGFVAGLELPAPRRPRTALGVSVSGRGAQTLWTTSTFLLAPARGVLG